MDSKKKVVIIGGGTAGMTIANNIQDFFDVIVIEKSKYKKYPLWYKMPLMIGLLFRNKKLKYMSKRDFVLEDGRHIPFFESNVLGGASLINGCVHMLGNKLSWSSILKKFNLSYDELTKSYEKNYSLDIKNSNKITLATAPQNLIDEAFIESLNSVSIFSGDMNLSNQEACGPILNTVRKFFRTSVLSLIKKNLFECFIGEKVERLLFNGSRVVGVKTNIREIHSEYVILSGGVIGTCDLLLREQLNNTNEDGNVLKGIIFGRDIQDHTNLRINVLTNKNIGSLNEISNSFYQKIALFAKHFTGQSSLIKGTGATSAVHLDLDKDGRVDTRIQVVQFSETGRHGSDGNFFSSSMAGFSLSITTINPKSRGVFKIEGEGNSVNPKFLSEKSDIELLKIALKFSLKLLKSKPLNNHIRRIEDEDIIQKNPEKYILDNIFSGHHLIGGTNDALNSDFEVKNSKGLFVCDASIFDQYAASNIHSSVVLMADMFSNKFIANNFKKQ